MRATYLTDIARRIRDDESKLTQADLSACLDAALAEYSHIRPNYTVADLTADGTAYLALPEDWDREFSKVARLDALDDDGAPTYVSPLEYAVLEVPDPDGPVTVLWLSAVTPAVGDQYRMKYAVRHVVTLTDSTVPSADEAAVIDLAAAYALLRLSAAYAQSVNPQLGAVTVDYRSKSDEYRQLSKEFRRQFADALRAARQRPSGRMSAWNVGSRGKQYH